MSVLMADAVTKMADAREGNRRFAAYTFANDLNLAADFTASKADFDKQVRAIRPAALPSQLYKAALEAIGKLSRETADRKALIILGDGDSDDTSYDHDQVLKAAKDAGVTIHALGYLAEAGDLPKFQTLQRLADDTGGYRKEVRVAGVRNTRSASSSCREVLENGGTVKFVLKEPPGPVTVTISADLGNGRVESTNYHADHAGRAGETHALSAERERHPDHPAGSERARRLASAPDHLGQEPRRAGRRHRHRRGLGRGRAHAPPDGRQGAAASAGGGDPKSHYGWLEMLDGNASRYPLKTTNVRIGRHRDNDICLHNDFDLATPRAVALQCRQPSLRDQGPGR